MNEESIINLIQLSISMGIVGKTRLISHVAKNNLVGQRKIAAVLSNPKYQGLYWTEKKGERNLRTFYLL